MLEYSVARYLFEEVVLLKKHYGPRLRMLHCCTDQTMTKALAEMELTAAQGHILVFLSRQEQPPCPRDVEEIFQLSHPTVSGLLNRLEKKEFIALRPDPADRRCKRICLLPKGRECLHVMDQTVQRIEARMVHGFTAQEQEQFSGLLDRAIENMGMSLHYRKYKEE